MDRHSIEPAIAGEQIALGAAMGVAFVGIVGSILSVIQARQMMEEFQRRCDEWENPDLRHQPIRREFTLARLAEIETYVFSTLKDDILTLREINKNLHVMAAEPDMLWSHLYSRIRLAEAGIRGDDAAAQEFDAGIDKPIPLPMPFNALKSPLHEPILDKLQVMRLQHETITKDMRGEVYGGNYLPYSESRHASNKAMWREFIAGQRDLEDVRNRLIEDNLAMVGRIEFAKDNLPSLINLYALAVKIYRDENIEEATKLFLKVMEFMGAEPSDEAFAAAMAMVPKA